VQVIVGNMPWRFSSYMAYCDNGAAQDEMPLYLFDKVRRQQQQQQHKCRCLTSRNTLWPIGRMSCRFTSLTRCDGSNSSSNRNRTAQLSHYQQCCTTSTQ
jgi:hypothetical protein